MTWPLPLYELTLLTDGYLAEHGRTDVQLTLTTPEEAPLSLFGAKASEAIGELLEARDVTLRARATPVQFAEGVLQLAPSGQLQVDAVVALPGLEGPYLNGIACDAPAECPATSAPSWERPSRPLKPKRSGGRQRRSSAATSRPSLLRSSACQRRHP